MSQSAFAQEEQSPAPPYVEQEQPVQTAPPPQAGVQTIYNYPTGSWVYAADRGWVWVPVGTDTNVVDGVPYAYLYTPAYGWTWYVSPWGWGPYRYGAWVGHPWRPVGWRGGWVAHPRVVTRIGAPHYAPRYAVPRGGGWHRR
jgi:hypothetical protein